MKQFYAILLLMLMCSCQQEKSNNAISEANLNLNRTLEVYDFNGLKPFLNKNDDKIHVVNFWATWCAPCVKELPYFEKVNKEYANKNVEVLLVSLDFPRKYESKLKPFIKKNALKSKVIAFDDVDQNTWIPAINEKWSGAIPATLIYKNNERKFYEGSFTYDELQNEIQQFLK